MKTKIPPPILALLFLIAMGAIAFTVPIGQFTLPGGSFVAGALIVMGLAVAISASRAFQKADTTINPLDPSKASNLVTSGVFAYTRNPMYLGLLMLLCAATIWFGNALNLALVVGFVWYMSTFQIAPEEDALTNLFGETYTDYCKRVRRWV